MKLLTEKEREKLQLLDTIAEELKRKIKEYPFQDAKSEDYAIELVQKIKVLKRFEIRNNDVGKEWLFFDPIKLTFFPNDCGLKDALPEERVTKIQNYVKDLLLKVNEISSNIIEFEVIGIERLDRFSFREAPCTFLINWEI